MRRGQGRRTSVLGAQRHVAGLPAHQDDGRTPAAGHLAETRAHDTAAFPPGTEGVANEGNTSAIRQRPHCVSPAAAGRS